MNRLLVVIGVLLALAACAPPGAAPSPSAKLPVRTAWVSNAVGLMVLPEAQDGGYFDKYGLDSSISFISGSETAAAALLAGDVDAVTMSGTAVVSADASGAELAMVAGFVHAGLYHLMAGPAVKSTDDVKGKTVAIVKAGDGTDYAWQAMAKGLGWGSNDVKVVSAGSQAGQITMLSQGIAQAAPFTLPNNILAEEQGMHDILPESGATGEEQGPGVVVSRAYLKDHRTQVLDVIKASVEAMHRWKTDPTFTRTVLSKYLKIDDQRYLDEAIAGYASIWPQAPYASTEGMQVSIDHVAPSNPKAKNVTPDQLIDTSLVKELEDSGFIKQIWGG
ncbi:MAG: ABC transporter substrate-binding protein [Chloroflexi bacterium]|nr:ABC transporter substrate-binding protein [Chloroflexota bacterium]